MDKERVSAKIKEMDSYLSDLKAISPEKLEDYLDEEKTKRACERLIQISIEAVIEISSEIAKSLDVGFISDEEDIFEKLKKKKAISEKLASILKQMKGFRNILVHRYGEVDDREVFSFIENDLEDFQTFRKEILEFLKRHR